MCNIIHRVEIVCIISISWQKIKVNMARHLIWYRNINNGREFNFSPSILCDNEPFYKFKDIVLPFFIFCLDKQWEMIEEQLYVTCLILSKANDMTFPTFCKYYTYLNFITKSTNTKLQICLKGKSRKPGVEW